MGPSQPVVLIIDDEADIAESYELWLRDEYEVMCADDGERGLAMLDDEVDVVLLDRMMPGLSGREVLASVREGPYDPSVAMITAVDPDFDIIEMGFDDYVTKPPSREELRRTVADLLDRDQMADRAREYRSLVATRAALESEKTSEELAESDEYARLEADIEDLEAAIDDDADALLDDAAFVGQLRELTEHETGGDEP